MFAPSYFAVTYFAGTYFGPAGSGGTTLPETDPGTTWTNVTVTDTIWSTVS